MGSIVEVKHRDDPTRKDEQLLDQAFNNHIERNRTLDALSGSTHFISSGPRDGLLTDSIADRHIMTIIEEELGRECLAMLIHGSKNANDDFSRLSASLEYFTCAAKAVYRATEDQISNSKTSTRYSQNALAKNLWSCSEGVVSRTIEVSTREQLQIEEIFELSRLILAVSNQYHKLSISLIEHNSLRATAGDKPTTKYSETWPVFDKYVIALCESESATMQELNDTKIAYLVMKNISGNHSTLSIPSPRTSRDRVAKLRRKLAS